MGDVLVGKLAIIGAGLIGGSLARRARGTFASEVVVFDDDPEVRARARGLGIGDRVADTLDETVRGAEIVVLAVPVGAFASVARSVGPCLRPGVIVSDVGSTKRSVVVDVAPHLPAGVQLVMAHPMAGTEFSGPESSFATLFEDRWCLIVPSEEAEVWAVERIEAMWRACGSMTERMTPDHHDRVVAAISHLPHLIAFTICGTAERLAAETGEGVLKFAASGFRDFTRIAASDPVMWRDVFLNNRDALLEMLDWFERDAAAMAQAIRAGDGRFIAERVEHGRAIRQRLIEEGQA